MYRLVLTVFLIISFTAKGQDYFNSEDFWKKLQVDTILVKKPQATDTSIVLVSTRAALNDKLRFMSEYREEPSNLKYFFIYTSGGTWHVLQVASLQKATSYLPDKNRNWVVYTEGMGKLFTTDVYRAITMAGQYRVNVVMLDYPSITTTKGRLGNYYFALRNAKSAYKDLLPILVTIKQMHLQHQLGNGKLSLFFHSMGNNVITETIFNNKLSVLNDVKWVDNLILNAPCVPETDHTDWLKQIKFAKHIYIHYNPEDHVLKGAHLVSFHKQLGEKIEYPVYPGAHYINFNTLCGEGHSNFLSLIGYQPMRKAAIRHYNLLLNGDTVQLHNTQLYRPSVYDHIGWDILP